MKLSSRTIVILSCLGLILFTGGFSYFSSQKTNLFKGTVTDVIPTDTPPQLGAVDFSAAPQAATGDQTPPALGVADPNAVQPPPPDPNQNQSMPADQQQPADPNSVQVAPPPPPATCESLGYFTYSGPPTANGVEPGVCITCDMLTFQQTNGSCDFSQSTTATAAPVTPESAIPTPIVVTDTTPPLLTPVPVTAAIEIPQNVVISPEPNQAVAADYSTIQPEYYQEQAAPDFSAQRAARTQKLRTVEQQAALLTAQEALKMTQQILETTLPQTAQMGTSLRAAAAPRADNGNLALGGTPRLRRAAHSPDTGPAILVYLGLGAVAHAGIFAWRKKKKA